MIGHLDKTFNRRVCKNLRELFRIHYTADVVVNMIGIIRLIFVYNEPKKNSPLRTLTFPSFSIITFTIDFSS